MGLYQGGPTDGESIEQLHHKDTDRDGAESSASAYSSQQGRGKTLVCITFFLEMIILGGVIVLEYFLRYSMHTIIRLYKPDYYNRISKIASMGRTLASIKSNSPNNSRTCDLYLLNF